MLSAGRLEIGLGAGWNQPEYDAIGLPFRPVGTRVTRLREAIAALKGCFGEHPFSFASDHYTITGHDGRPKPVQRPHPPFFIGSGGRRILTLAGQEADIVGMAPRMMPMAGGHTQPRADPRSLTAAATRKRSTGYGTPPGTGGGQIEINVYSLGDAPVAITNHARAEGLV